MSKVRDINDYRRDGGSLIDLPSEPMTARPSVSSVGRVQAPQTAEPWQPSPLVSPERPPLPRDIYPAVYEEHADACARQTGSPYENAILAVDVTIATLAQRAVRVRRPDGYSQPINTYALVVAESGQGKSGADKIHAPLHAVDQRRRDRDELLASIARDKHAAIEAKIKRLCNGGQAEGGESIESLRKEQRELGPLEAGGLLAPASHPASVAGCLLASGGAGTIVSEESTPLYWATGAGKSDELVDAGIYIKGYDGRPYDHKTAARGRERIPCPLLSILTTTQPAKLALVPNDGSGLLARFRCVYPNPVKKDWTELVTTTATEPDYVRAIENLAGWADEEGPVYLDLSRAADRELGEYLNARDRMMEPGGRFADAPLMREWLAKRGELLRHAGRLHLAHGGDGRAKVTEETIARAIAWDGVLMEHAAALFAGTVPGVSTVADLALKAIRSPGLAKIALANGAVGTREVSKYVRGVDTSKRAEAVLEYLHAHGWARELEAKSKWRRWQLHPDAGKPCAGM